MSDAHKLKWEDSVDKKKSLGEPNLIRLQQSQYVQWAQIKL